MTSHWKALPRVTKLSGHFHKKSPFFTETWGICHTFSISLLCVSGRAPRELQNARHRLLECDYRSQNKMPLEKCALTFRMAGSSNWEYVSLGNGLTVSLANPQRALTAGQYAAFYQGEVCLGSAKIERVGPSLYTMNHNNCRTKILQSLSDKKSDSKGI